MDVIDEGKRGIQPGEIPFCLKAVSSIELRPLPKSTVENRVEVPKLKPISILPLPKVRAMDVESPNDAFWLLNAPSLK